ncbi:hypothetical protein K501DRAFT_272032 [Backusella circina FSU 941]|nr:hypothetical protein K501DRAFT_272032 [Backusella circina FSU 941]
MNKVDGVDIKSSRISFWDLGGQRDLHSIWERYYSECHAIVFEVDVTVFIRLSETRRKNVYKQSSREANRMLHSSLRIEEIKHVFDKMVVKLATRQKSDGDVEYKTFLGSKIVHLDMKLKMPQFGWIDRNKIMCSPYFLLKNIMILFG